MNRKRVLTHEFVEFIPEDMKEGTIYVSIPYATVAHRCCCGCGGEVFTPLSPTDWKLIFDGQSISLYPSIGNWSFDCQSHYWIESNAVKWDHRWSREEIEAGRAMDTLAKDQYYGGADLLASVDAEAAGQKAERAEAKDTVRQKLWRWLSRLLR
jgi:hypothetical protein